VTSVNEASVNHDVFARILLGVERVGLSYITVYSELNKCNENEGR